MKSTVQFLKTTVIGGLLFLVPVIIVIAIVGKAFEIMKKVAEPLSKFVPVDSVADIAILDLMALVFIVAVCFVAGLVARTAVASRMIDKLESRFLTNIPVYDVIKTKIQATITASEETGMTPVLARFDDQWQIALVADRLDGGRVVLYLPGSPDPWSGTVAIVSEDRIEPLDTSLPPVMKTLKGLGKGSHGVFAGDDRRAQPLG